MIPDMSDVLREWEVDVTIKTIVRTTTNFVESRTVTSRTQKAVVQPADMSKINKAVIDWSRDYKTIHSREAIALNEYIEFEDADYKVISVGKYGRYGFHSCLAESTNKAVIS